MSLAWPILAARLRLRWRTLLAIALLAGLGLGASAAAIAAARRTDSVYRRVAESQSAVHMEWSHASSPQELRDQLQADPNPALGTVRQWVGFVDAFDTLGVAADMLAPWQSEAHLELPFVIEGDVADRANELTVDELVAERSGVGVGDSVQLGLLKSDFSEPVPFDFVVTGIVTLPAEVGTTDDTAQSPTIFLSRAFAEAHPEHMVWYGAGAVLDGGTPSRTEASALAEPYGWTLENLSIDKEAKARAALRPAVTSLYVLGALGLFASAAVLAFALSRELEVWSNDRSVLRSLGAPRRRRRIVDGLHVAMVTAASLVTAMAALIVLSPLGPVGDLRRFDREIGFRADWFASAVAVGCGLAAAFLAVALATRESTPPKVVVPARDVAASLLAGSATSSLRTVGMTMLLGVLAVTAAAAAIPYVTSLSTLVDEPARYGQPWNVMARNRWGDQSSEAIATIADDPSVVAASTIASGSISIDGLISAPAARYEVVKGPNLLTIVAGRAAVGESEAVIGARTRRQLGVELGETVEVERLRASTAAETSSGPCCGEPQQVTLVGDALFPALSLPGGAVPRLDQGIMVSPAIWEPLTAVEDRPEVTLLSTSSDSQASQLAAMYPQIEDLSFTAPRTEWLIGARPAEIRNVERARNFMIWGLVALSAVIAAVLGLALRTILSGQRRSLAILRALGATRRQVRLLAWKQGAMLFVPLTVLGVPTGIALGRLLYERLARSIGVVSEPETPWWAVITFIIAFAIMSAISVFLSGRAAGNVAPAPSLREP